MRNSNGEDESSRAYYREVISCDERMTAKTNETACRLPAQEKEDLRYKYRQDLR
jgi:hypothetical protein